MLICEVTTLDEIYLSKVYVFPDDQGRVIKCDGGYTTPSDLTGWVQIDEGSGDKYNLCQSHYFEGGLYTQDGIPRYKLAQGRAVERTEAEIQADRLALPAPEPTADELMNILLGVKENG
jgi:hypothetical protein